MLTLKQTFDIRWGIDENEKQNLVMIKQTEKPNQTTKPQVLPSQTPSAVEAFKDEKRHSDTRVWYRKLN